MRDIYIKKIEIENVRHLKNIIIPVGENQPKHLILTGKNGSGKTSVLDSMSRYLHAAATSDALTKMKERMLYYKTKLDELRSSQTENEEYLRFERQYEHYKKEYLTAESGIKVEFNNSTETIHFAFEKGEFLLAYYKADRVFETEIPKHIENIELKDKYQMTESPRKLLVKYLADLKVKEALSRAKGNLDKAEGINSWFEKLQDLLRDIFDDRSLELVFDEETYKFSILETGREPFGFNELSSGYAAVLDIVLDLIIRMEKYTNRSFDFNMPGIVLVDEIETHLHVELQRNIMKMLTTLFPNIQFIITTHSAFILNCTENAVIYDLERHVRIENGLTNVPYDGIIESYFEADTLSDELRRKFERYKELANKKNLNDADFDELAELEIYLEEIPDYLAIDIAAEYKRLKLYLEGRGDL